MDDNLKRRAELFVEMVRRFDRAKRGSALLQVPTGENSTVIHGPSLSSVFRDDAEREQQEQVARWVRARLRELPPLELPPEHAPENDVKLSQLTYRVMVLALMEEDAKAMLAGFKEINRLIREHTDAAADDAPGFE